MSAKAWRSMSGSWSARVAWKLRLTYGRTTLGKSAWWWRPVSWNGPRLNWPVGTLPVIARKAEESISAEPSATGRFAEPGPHDVSVATGSPRTRNHASAMNPATDSWWTEIVAISARRSYSASSIPRSPWPHMANTYGTPSRTRYSAMTWPPRRVTRALRRLFHDEQQVARYASVCEPAAADVK